jgi:hypothetical protein
MLWQSVRKFSLVARGHAGLACDEEGVALGPSPLAVVGLDEAGFRRCDVVPVEVLERILSLAYGPQTKSVIQHCHSSLRRIATSIEEEELGRAGIEAVMMRLLALSPDAMAKLVEADDFLKAGTAWENQPRVPAGQTGGGQWTSDGSGVGQAARSEVDVVASEGSEPARLDPAPIGSATPGEVNAVTVDEVANRDYHDEVVAKIARILEAHGCIVVTEIPLVAVNDTFAIADILMMPPTGKLTLIEVKTGQDPKYEESQRVIYPMAMIGDHVFSPDARIAEFGLEPMEPLPPIDFVVAYKRDRKTMLHLVQPDLTDEYMLPGSK